MSKIPNHANVTHRRKAMAQSLSDQLIDHKTNLPHYSPPGHGGTVNVRLFDKSFCGNFEIILGVIEPGGVADKHHHEHEHQAMYVLSGVCEVTLGEEAPVECGPGAVIRLPPLVDHHVLSKGPEPLQLMIVYSPPLPSRDDTPLD
jgi:quercetin dioxygenase-like cupin family protein